MPLLFCFIKARQFFVEKFKFYDIYTDWLREIHDFC